MRLFDLGRQTERTKKAKSIYLKYRVVPAAILKDLGRVSNRKKMMLRKGVRGCQLTREEPKRSHQRMEYWIRNDQLNRPSDFMLYSPQQTRMIGRGSYHPYEDKGSVDNPYSFLYCVSAHAVQG
jgi:hypothetical protein